MIDSQTHFGCNTHHRSRILISCAVGAIIICASVCGILKKMIEMTWQQLGNSSQSICAFFLFFYKCSSFPRTFFNDSFFFISFPLPVCLSSYFTYLFPPYLLIHDSQVLPHFSLFCISLSETLSVSNLGVFCLDSPWKVSLSEVDPAVTEISVGGLTPAKTYQFRLCAVNQVGRGQYSGETQR